MHTWHRHSLSVAHPDDAQPETQRHDVPTRPIPDHLREFSAHTYISRPSCPVIRMRFAHAPARLRASHLPSSPLALPRARRAPHTPVAYPAAAHNTLMNIPYAPPCRAPVLSWHSTAPCARTSRRPTLPCSPSPWHPPDASPDCTTRAYGSPLSLSSAACASDPSLHARRSPTVVADWARGPSRVMPMVSVISLPVSRRRNKDVGGWG